jgi:DNA-binding transcriptional ArsR family regulator/uncharacterized protein YndB with AHSA1/START domain
VPIGPTGARDALVWEALADPTRRRLLDLLRPNPRTTGWLCSQFRFSRTAVMKHLDVLERAGLITVRRRGRERWNYVNATPLRRIYERWLTPYQQIWASSLSQLATVIEGAHVDVSPAERRLSHAEIVQTVSLAAPPTVVFDALTDNIARWWSHNTYEHSGKPDLRLERRVGGRFFEAHGANERLYAIVTRVEPPSLLALEGAMGMSGCVFGTIVFEVASQRDGSDVTVTHTVMGLCDDATVDMYRSGWRSLLEGDLKAFVERGKEAWSAA